MLGRFVLPATTLLAESQNDNSDHRISDDLALLSINQSYSIINIYTYIISRVTRIRAESTKSIDCIDFIYCLVIYLYHCTVTV